jgi:dTDP-glucose 4,6-dehydratase
MKILVTGGAGFIGSHYVRTLLGGGYPGFEDAQVTVLDKLTYAGNLANLEGLAASPRFSFIRGDICDASLLASVVPGHDIVINFAAETHVDRSILGASDFVATDVTGVQVLLQACLDAQVARVVQISTDEVYGSIGRGSWTETAPVAPNSPYAAAKAGGDLLARAYARTHGLNISITRCCNNYGPYQYPEKVIPLFVTNLLDGQNIPLYGDGRNIRGWIHVDDHCRGIQLVLERGEPGAVYHINGDVELTNIELTTALLEYCDGGWDMVTQVADRKGHDRRYSLDDSRLRSMGYRPQISFSVGLSDTVRWYQDNRRWWEPLKRPRQACQASAPVVTPSDGQAAATLPVARHAS